MPENGQDFYESLTMKHVRLTRLILNGLEHCITENQSRCSHNMQKGWLL